MFSGREFEGGSIADFMDPQFREVTFTADDDKAQWTVATLLRYAWHAAPDTIQDQEVGAWMAAFSHVPTEERQSHLQYDDKEVHTIFRDQVYEFWSHVFWDVMRFLMEASGTVGHYHPPTHEVFPLYYPLEAGEPLTKTWDSQVLLVHAFTDTGVSIRLSTDLVSGEGNVEVKDRGSLSAEKAGAVWYLRKDTQAKFYIEIAGQEEGESRRGLAAVLIVAPLHPGERCPGHDQLIQEVEDNATEIVESGDGVIGHNHAKEQVNGHGNKLTEVGMEVPAPV